MPRVMPSLPRVIVQNSDFGIGEGERHCTTVCRHLGDVVMASKVCHVTRSAIYLDATSVWGQRVFVFAYLS